MNLSTKIFLLLVACTFTLTGGLLLNQTAEGSQLKGKMLVLTIEKPLLISGKVLYKDIVQYDNSDPRISGGFVKDGSDIKRTHTKLKNSCAFYQYDKTFRIMILPPQCRDVLPLIEIIGNLDEYHRKDQMKVTENKTSSLKDSKAFDSKRVYFKDRYVDATCTNAKINANNWQVILPDTIEYLKNNCDPKFTKLKTTIEEYKPITKHDYTTSSKYKLEQFYKQVKECGKVKNGCKDLINRQVTTTPATK